VAVRGVVPAGDDVLTDSEPKAGVQTD
jgi:hypothetical protein